MTVHTAAPSTARPDRTLVRALFYLTGAFVLVVVILVAVIVLFAGRAPVSATTVSATLLETASVIDTHGAAMIDHGDRLAAAAQSSKGPDREHWIADGRQMAADGASLRALADRIRAAARVLGGDPTARSSLDLYALGGEAASLIEEGQAAAQHGRGMIAHATVMQQLAAKPDSGISVADAILMSADAPELVAAGESVAVVGTQLQGFVSQMQRSLGR